MGGRGVGNTVEEILVNPLSRALFDNPVNSGGSAEVESVVETGAGWELKVSVSQ